jgi:hypothetical protein
MMHGRSACLAAMLVMSTTAAAQEIPAPGQPQSTQAARATVTVRRVATPPKIDDYLSGERRDGLQISGFLQRSPGDLTPVTEPTEAFLSYDSAHIYVVFVCRASDPSRIRAHMARRESVFGDDHVALFLDTFNDRQRAYMFFVSPLGIQADGITTEGQGDDMSFDAVWRSEARRTDFGYVVWMAIPFKSLRFPRASGPQTWGLAMLRSLPLNNEQAFWPGITLRTTGFASQFAEARGFEDVSAGRNLQLVPYATFTGARVLDTPAAALDANMQGRVGLDAKFVVKDAFTVDFTANPDFSQVESDEPQVTVNQRFEVFFPEKRPFFLENAGFFQAPLTLFFSRRVRDPQLGIRMTGKMGPWAAGALTMDDRAQGQLLPRDDPRFGDRAFNAIATARREFGLSSVGALVTSRDFGPASSRVASVDTRLSLTSHWVVDGQAAFSGTSSPATPDLRDAAYSASINRSGRKVGYSLTYQDIGEDFRAPLGFVPRTDIRQATSFGTLRWRPAKGPVQAFGPNSFVQGTWNTKGELQDWLVRFPFQIDLKRQSMLFVRRAESLERFAGREFRQHENFIQFNTSYFSWMDFTVYTSSGTRPNFFPSVGIEPALANYRDAFVALTFRPTSSLLIDETYLYSQLTARPESGQAGTIFNNHIVRTKVNYQFTRALSVRGILDYNGVLANPALVALQRTKHLTADVLMTYLLSPGTALYVGFTDGYDNVLIDPILGVRQSRSPTTSTGRQFFVKTSYLFKF